MGVIALLTIVILFSSGSFSCKSNRKAESGVVSNPATSTDSSQGSNDEVEEKQTSIPQVPAMPTETQSTPFDNQIINASIVSRWRSCDQLYQTDKAPYPSSLSLTAIYNKDGTFSKVVEFHMGQQCQFPVTSDDIKRMVDATVNGDEKFLSETYATPRRSVGKFRVGKDLGGGLIELDILINGKIQYTSYAVVNSKLHVAAVCNQADIAEGFCPAVTGSLPENRAVNALGGTGIPLASP